MSTLLQQLERISQRLQTASDAASLAQQLGEITQDKGSEIVVQPDDAMFTQLSVVTEPESSAPAHIRLHLVEPVSLSTLSKQLGVPQKLPSTSQGKHKQIFNAAYQGESYNVTLIFEGKDSTADLVLRRDLRLI